MKKIVREGEMLPRGYGIAYFDLNQLIYVCYPFPINHFVAWSRWVWRKIRDSKQIRVYPYKIYTDEVSTWYRCVGIEEFAKRVGGENYEITGVVFEDNNIGFNLKRK